MSELLGLGAADGESRWIGVRRHQAVLAIVGLGLVGEWLTQPHAGLVELVDRRRPAVLRGADEDGLTVGERLRIAVELRGSFSVDVDSRVAGSRDGDDQRPRRRRRCAATNCSIADGSTSRVETEQNALALAEFADALATSDDDASLLAARALIPERRGDGVGRADAT